MLFRHFTEEDGVLLSTYRTPCSFQNKMQPRCHCVRNLATKPESKKTKDRSGLKLLSIQYFNPKAQMCFNVPMYLKATQQNLCNPKQPKAQMKNFQAVSTISEHFPPKVFIQMVIYALLSSNVTTMSHIYTLLSSTPADC